MRASASDRLAPLARPALSDSLFSVAVCPSSWGVTPAANAARRAASFIESFSPMSLDPSLPRPRVNQRSTSGPLSERPGEPPPQPIGNGLLYITNDLLLSAEAILQVGDALPLERALHLALVFTQRLVAIEEAGSGLRQIAVRGDRDVVVMLGQVLNPLATMIVAGIVREGAPFALGHNKCSVRQTLEQESVVGENAR